MAERTVFALGFFDGIHLGHTALLRRAAEMARLLDATPAVMSFDVHPDALISGRPVPLINSAEDRISLIRRLSGIERVYFIPFTRETMQIPWKSFLEEVSRGCRVAGYVVGYDFHFGWQGQGTPERLGDYCREAGIGCDVIPPVCLNGEVVSSTGIRLILERGDISLANRLLGHPHLLSGVPVHGLLPWPRDVLALPRGEYSAAVTFSDGGSSQKLFVTCEKEGVRLPPHFSDRRVFVEFTSF